MSKQSLKSTQLRGMIFVVACFCLAFFLILPIYVQLQHCVYTGPRPSPLLRRFNFFFTNTSLLSSLFFSAVGGISGLSKLNYVDRGKISLVFFSPSLFYLILRLYPAEGVWTLDSLAAALFFLGVFVGSAWVVLIRPIYHPGEEGGKRDLKG